ncbi:aspartate ammonia-lyase [Yinghuangia soli]|uniref:Aspartate ammonia-lyase n=1 Tax=Yinghuangia soli TaxID=2908204 RepID=A0AA41Q5V7_9ACTN|nr:aspartate ammonia-lyase [Yinghuangia soli]MCF2531530.1 aspartate ammonia-lyase [Yinghuangia soli]
MNVTLSRAACPRPAARSDGVVTAMRVERDLLGEREIPWDAYYGIHTLRAMENFPLTGVPLSWHPGLVSALACVKQAAAAAHLALGTLPEGRAGAITAACTEVRAGRLHEFFTVDVLQGGAGTSSNMNANEVIANRGLELLGHDRGDYRHLHPNDDVNRGQSTNDVYPTAVKLALYSAAAELADTMEGLAAAFGERASRFAGVVKLGRTQLQDAVPMTLGQEFRAFALTVADDAEVVRRAAGALCEVNLGGTAIGTGLNADRGFREAAVAALAALSGVPVLAARDPIESTQGVGGFLELSGALRRFALRLGKVCNDLRLLASGPQGGFGELHLPSVQAGSSIMPGKVNPVIPEAVNQVCFDVVGSDAAVTLAAQAGQLQLNAFEPLIAHHLLTAVKRLDAACRVLGAKCVSGIGADADRTRGLAERSPGLATALNPVLGYGKATELAQRSSATRRSVRDLAVEESLLTPAEAERILDPLGMAHPTVQGQGRVPGPRQAPDTTE